MEENGNDCSLVITENQSQSQPSDYQGLSSLTDQVSVPVQGIKSWADNIGRLC